MLFDDLLTWPLIATLCSFVLFLEGMMLFRTLFLTRQPLWRYLLAVIPSGVSLWAFGTVIHSLNLLNRLPPFGGNHITPALIPFVRMLSMGIMSCQIAAGITVGVFLLVLVVERMLHIQYVSFRIHGVSKALPECL